MPKFTRICACGHVAESDKGLIEGKRYSGYRAEIYSRLEIRRMLYENLEEGNLIARKWKSKKDKDKVVKLKKLSKVKKRRRRPKLSSSRLINSSCVFRRHNLTKMDEKLSRDIQDREETENWDAGKRFDLSAALAEINKKFTSQSMFWINLSTTELSD